MITVNNAVKFSNKKQPNDMELKGLSTDVKPTEVNGNIVGVNSIFLELDTNDFYYFDGEEWQKVVIEGGGSGEYDRDIAEIRNELKKRVYYFDNVANMKNTRDLQIGEYAITKGYYTANDGGAGEYLIRTKAQDDVDDGGSIHFISNNLVAELIVRDNTVSVKQFGAKGDGVFDDTQAFKNALKYVSIVPTVYISKGNYLISDNLVLPDGTNLIGENTKKSIITLSDWEGEHCITNENFEYNGNIDTITIENITFLDTKVTDANTGRLFGLANTNNCVIQNVLFKCEIDTRVSPIDIRSNNKNMLINKMDCYFTAPTTISRNCLNIREFASYPNINDRYTDNIHVTNCNMYCSGIDEILWIDSWNGRVSNIYVDNCNFYDVSEYDTTLNNLSQIAENMIAISGKHIYITNCHFYKQSLRYYMARIGINHIYPSEDIKISDCHFEIGDSKISTNSRILSVSDSANNIINSGVEIYNNLFTIRQNSADEDYKKPLATIIYSYEAEQKVDIHNNRILCTSQFACYNIPTSKNDIIKNSDNGFKNVSLIDGIQADVSKHLIDNTSGHIPSQIKILNSEIKTGNRVIATSGNTSLSKLLIQNCNIENETTAISNYGNTVNMTIICISCNFKGNIIANPTSQTLIINGVIVDNDIVKGIPSNQDLRGALAVGTVLFSSTQGKSIARKISDGNSVSNWEEL